MGWPHTHAHIYVIRTLYVTSPHPHTHTLFEGLLVCFVLRELNFISLVVLMDYG